MENKVGREKSGETVRFRKPREVKNTAKEITTTSMVLRSHKRKLEQAKQNNNVNLSGKKKKTSTFCDTSDCIVLNDSDSIDSNTDVTKLITSTPIRQNSLGRTNFNMSCIQYNENNKPHDNNTDVIVISDSSAPTLPLIVISDDESEAAIPLDKQKPEIMPEKNTCEETPKKNDAEVLKDVINKKYRERPRKSNVTRINQKRIIENRSKFNSRKPRTDRRNISSDKPVRRRSRDAHAHQFGGNIYVENPVVLPKSGLRPIIIDGSNVAFHHSNNSYFSCKGLEICIKYFKNRGHEVIAFVPQYRVQYKESDNPRLLDQLVRSGDVVLTPSRIVNGNRIVPYDDRFIVQTAVIKGGIIVTRDNYRDLLIENPSWAETIQYRLLQFTWVQDLLMFPNDPLGKRGPSLEEFLRFG